MVMEKATDSTKEITLTDVGLSMYVVDGRWMSYNSNYDGTALFSCEIATGGPTE